MKINTFLIGAQKAGTTSLYDWLGQHDDVLAPDFIKDYHHFTAPSLQEKADEYLESFYKSKSKVLLHSAVNYLYFSEKCAERLHNYNPDAKLLICLRKPQDRAISAYKYFVRSLRETNSLADSLSLELSNSFTDYASLSNRTYISHGKYSSQISDYLKYFPRNQIHFTIYEELINPDMRLSVMQEVYDFLQINSNVDINFKHLNKSSSPKSNIINVLLRGRGIKMFKNLLPLKFRKNLSKKIEQLNLSNDEISVYISDEELNLLDEYLNDECELTGDIIAKKLDFLWA
ncbi:sulfotransferase domain-containing protein [Algoriphagus machipongonensis]|uniref:Sulfotransferase n=1 Tax=Algoriphagus machipongonensis TaxID=388413 RepID=A3HRR2_9BACT|nr:sulfotransferase domain-containing protein [Algoriphagus machipongonensis]EAZ82530.1 sulfotransferase [Algoriphagus machipongonensis]